MIFFSNVYNLKTLIRPSRVNNNEKQDIYFLSKKLYSHEFCTSLIFKDFIFFKIDDNLKLYLSCFQNDLSSKKLKKYFMSSTAALSGFQLFRSDRKDNKTGGGVCIFVRDGIQAIEAQESSFLSKECEQIWVSIRLEDESPLLVGCIYRPPPKNVSNAVQVTDSCISRSIYTATQLLADRAYSSVILMDDFNMPDVGWSENGTPVVANVASPS
ncbi:RNA-directed DNA polymerase from mobile element jockey-like, partial [Brachionus plicatilis]